MTTDLPTLKQKRGRAQGTISRLKNYISTLAEGSDAVDIESRFSNLKDSFRDFCEYDDQIATFPNESSNIEIVEEIFYTAQAAFRRHINPANTNQHDISQHQQPHVSLDETLNLLASQQLNLIGALHERPQSELRMPTLTIPQFNGSYATWPSFQDLYKSIVHTNSRLSKIQKFQYLKGLLIGDAADQIRHILVTEENYDTAWEKLVDRYDKKKQIINNYIKTFIEQPQLNFASATQLRRLADTSDEVIRGLGTVGPDAQKRDPWLIYILLQKTDDYTRQLWAIKASEKKLHSFDEFIQFINERCDALEAYTAHNPFFESNNSQQQQYAVYTQSTNRFGSSSQPGRCPKCSGAHPLFKCQLFKTLPVPERRKLVLRAKLCFNCMHDGHQTSSCSSTYRCHYCNDKHHSSLHQHEQIRTHYTDVPSITERSTPSYSLTEAQHQEEHQEPFPTQSYSASHITQSACPTVLPAALVYVQDEQGKSRPYRALLDSGSMVSFVSESCAQLLGIKRKHHRSSVCGLSSIEVAVTKGEVVLKLYTLNGIINLRALVLQKVTSPLPSVDISTKAWPWIHKHKLADPFFYKSQNIDILIGADYFFQVLENGQIKFSPNDPILQKTVFGWVVAGPHYQCENQSNDNPKSYQVTIICDIDRTLTKFWEVETVSATNNYLTDEEKHCETHFKTHLCFNLDDRLIVRLPFTKSSEHLGNSKRTAVSCLLSMERRLANDPELYQQYRNFMNEYIAMGHMQKIPSSEVNIADNKGFYLPHHAVVKPSSTTTKLSLDTRTESCYNHLPSLGTTS
ncbi:uncharacterized protein LOC129907116 [Episyrphus balteatus]|uniref:uncharacterized protein LOC129907116 n=1 Tax=Episyrphus balteatus TaxID=286459 RepID=UPI00248547B0|nr:uncharacterized protein LOC129907116 [Episyrphus balteatus]